jgi:hypothetical protein
MFLVIMVNGSTPTFEFVKSTSLLLQCANNVYLPCLFLPLVLFIAAEKKRQAEEAQQSGPNAAQSNGTVSFFFWLV